MLMKLLKKEFLLSMHPTVPVMLLLSAMVLIPNYPYSVVYFYTTLAIFFTCLSGRENHDLDYTLTLPIAKRDIVRGRMGLAAAAQMNQMLIAIPFVFLSSLMNPHGNDAGMDANIVFFACGFLLYGVFNLIFFLRYYKNVNAVGISFLIASAVLFLMIGVEITLTFTVSFARNKLDTPDPMFMGEKLIVLTGAVLIYLVCTFSGYKGAVKRLEQQDL